MTESPDFSALIGSRICHDLVNPISAIGNGIELMIMGGAARSPELALIEESVANANARIRFFRIAFGSGSDRRIARGEVLSILSDMTQGARIQCFETVMPYGGTLAVAQGADGWQITGRSSRFRVDEALWARLARPEAQTDVAPAHVQFALLPLGVADIGRRLGLERTETEIRLHF